MCNVVLLIRKLCGSLKIETEILNELNNSTVVNYRQLNIAHPLVAIILYYANKQHMKNMQ